MERFNFEKVIKQKRLEHLLGVSSMTIYLWRKLEVDPLPCRTVPTEGGKHKVYFCVEEVKSWVIRNRPNLHKKLGGTHATVNSGRDSRDFLDLSERLSA